MRYVVRWSLPDMIRSFNKGPKELVEEYSSYEEAKKAIIELSTCAKKCSEILKHNLDINITLKLED